MRTFLSWLFFSSSVLTNEDLMNRKLLSVALLLSLWPLSSARATVILSNLPGSAPYINTIGLTTTSWAGVGLTTGSTAENFGSVSGMFGNSATSAATLEGGIYSSVSSHPGTLLSAFTNVTIPANTSTPALFSLVAASSFTMQPSTAYWLVFHDQPSVGLFWTKDNAASGTIPTASAGHAYNGLVVSGNSGGAWSVASFNNTVEVNVTPTPEPGTLVLGSLGAAGLLLVARRRRRSGR
jgi:hypothetical protein